MTVISEILNNSGYVQILPSYNVAFQELHYLINEKPLLVGIKHSSVDLKGFFLTRGNSEKESVVAFVEYLS